MEVTVGWATDYARSKFTVTLDEADLIRILADGGLEDLKPILLTSSECFKLLDTEARMFAEAEKMHHLPAGSPDRGPVVSAVQELQGLKKRYLDQIRERFSRE